MNAPKKRDKRRFSEKIEKEICELYNEGKSASQIGKELNIEKGNIYYVLKLFGIKSRDASSPFYKKNLVNDDFFEKIDSEEKAYFLGFLCADGYMLKRDSAIKLELQLSDADIVKKLTSFLFKKERYLLIRKNSIRMVAYSQKMYQDLENLGLHQAKSLTLKFPPRHLIPNNLMNHFIRGVFDGDGCMYHTLKPNVRQKGYFQITGSRDFLEGVLDQIGPVIGKVVKLYQPKNNNAWEFRYVSPTHIKAVYEYLYESATIFLSRKKEKFEKFFLKEDNKAVS